MIDIAIIGGGPAGLSAAVNAAVRNKKAVVFGRKMETSWLYKAEQVDNHLGMPHMTGKEMLEKFHEHAVSLGVEIKEGRILQIMPMGDRFSINFDNEIFEAKRIVLATGIAKESAVTGESAYIGRGVSYCATCDGMLYRGKTVAVISEIEEGEEDIAFLSEICENVIVERKYNTGLSEKPNVTTISGKISEITGGDYVTGIIVDGKEVAVDGVFIIKGTTPTDSLVFGLKTENNAIIVNRSMETSVKHVYACGDCTGWPFQLSKAVGEGQIAAQNAVKTL